MRIKNKNKGYAQTGLLLAFFSLGALYSLQLVRYAYLLLVIAVLIVVYYVNESVSAHFMKGKLKLWQNLFGFFGAMLLILFLGVQSPQWPFAVYSLFVGLALLIPLLINSLKRKF